MYNQNWRGTAKTQKHVSQCYCFLIKKQKMNTFILNWWALLHFFVAFVVCFVLCFCCCHLNFPSKKSFHDSQSCVILFGFSFNKKTQRTHPLFTCMSLFLWLLTSFYHIFSGNTRMKVLFFLSSSLFSKLQLLP